MLQTRVQESQQEKAALRDALARLEKEHALVKAKEDIDKRASSLRVAKVQRGLNLNDYIVRLKTTSVEADKYAEVLSVILGLCVSAGEGLLTQLK